MIRFERGDIVVRSILRTNKRTREKYWDRRFAVVMATDNNAAGYIVLHMLRVDVKRGDSPPIEWIPLLTTDEHNVSKVDPDKVPPAVSATYMRHVMLGVLDLSGD